MWRFKKPRQVEATFAGPIVIVGFGSIGQGVLPLILRHIEIDRKNIHIVTGDDRGRMIARKEGVNFHVQPLDAKNYKKIVSTYLKSGGFLVNLSVDVSSESLVRLCQEIGALYIDTCIEPWPGGYYDASLSLAERTNYTLREHALKLKDKFRNGTTAILAHGANPGIISHFLKQALLNIAEDTGLERAVPSNQEEWSGLARDLGVKTIHVSEYDSQVSRDAKQIGRFENTWSVNGFLSEGVLQPSELGWGTHEKSLPKDARRHTHGSKASIYLLQPGARTLVKTWTPNQGQFLGHLVTHHESIAIADFLSVRDGKRVFYRPTVHYAYRPCDAAVLSLDEALGTDMLDPPAQRILLDDIVAGMDELGVLIMGHKKGAYWYGSQLDIDTARSLAPYQNATGLQVTSGVVAAMIWAMENPQRGLVEAEDLDFKRIMELITPYMGRMYGEYTDWTPVQNRKPLFPNGANYSDPWQFKNFRVS
jgi:homospermidine synthase